MSDSTEYTGEASKQVESQPGVSNPEGGQGNPTLEQWKHYEQTARDVSNRRLKNNRFYQRLLGATVAGVGIAAKFDAIGPFVYLVVGAVGVAVSLLWMMHVVSYKQLNSGKYQVLQDLEEQLQNQPFADEWKKLDRGRDPTTFVTHTSVEIWWPRVALWVFGGMALYGSVLKLQAGDLTDPVLFAWSVLTLFYWGAAFRGWKPFETLGKAWKQREEN